MPPESMEIRSAAWRMPTVSWEVEEEEEEEVVVEVGEEEEVMEEEEEEGEEGGGGEGGEGEGGRRRRRGRPDRLLCGSSAPPNSRLCSHEAPGPSEAPVRAPVRAPARRREGADSRGLAATTCELII